MTRIRLRTGPAALFGAMLVVALIALMPMRAVLGWVGVGEQGFVAREVSGSVWRATLTEARFGDLALGDLHATLSPLPLLVGRARIALSGGRDAAQSLHGAIVASRHSVGVEDLTARVATGRLFAPVPVTALDFDSLSVRFRDARCESAEGRVRATLTGEAGGIALPPLLSGTARCDGAALLLPMTSQAGTEGIALRIDGDGGYRGDLSLRPSDPATIQKLEAAGFVAGPGGYRLAVEGHL